MAMSSQSSLKNFLMGDLNNDSKAADDTGEKPGLSLSRIRFGSKLYFGMKSRSGGVSNPTGDMHEVHFERIYEMMRQFDEFCVANDLTYCLAFGTLLGAVRHKGFIPWDHDADLIMPWEDYKKLRKIFDEGRGPKDRALVDRWSVPGYITNFGRFMDTSTSRYNPKDLRGLLGDPAGVFIDVFPLIPMRGTTDEELDRFTARFQCFSELRIKYVRRNQIRNDIFFEEWAKIQEDIEKRGRDAVLADLDQELFSVPVEECTYYLHSSSGPAFDWRFKREWFERMERTNMDGHLFNIPSAYPEILTTMYGPGYRYYPSDNHVGIGRNLFTSLKVPCDVVKKELREEVDVDEYLATRELAKCAQMEESVRLHEQNVAILGLVESWTVQRIKVAEQQINKTATEALAQEDWASLDTIFAGFYEIYTTRCYARLHASVILPGEYLEAAVLNLICKKGDVGLAYKILERRKERAVPLDDKEREIDELFKEVIGIRGLIETGKDDQARKLINSVLAKNAHVLTATACDLWIGLNHEDADPDKALTVAREEFARTGHPCFTFLEAEALRKKGDAKSAGDAYRKVEKTSNDGFILRITGERLKEVSHEDN